MRPKSLWVDADAGLMKEYPFHLERQYQSQGFRVNIWRISDQPDYLVLHCMERLAKEKFEYGYRLSK